MSDLIAEVRDLRMRYGTKEVLNGVGFSVRTGEVLAMLGPNGAGKTTTIEILEGFRMRSAGDVSVLGSDPAHAGEQWRARIGVVLQAWRDHAKWRVRELLKHLPGWLQGIGQVFPMYWLGLGMRAALLPRSLAAVEIDGSWRLGYVLLALCGWAAVGLLAAPPVLRRMARHESGSKVAARRERAMLRAT